MSIPSFNYAFKIYYNFREINKIHIEIYIESLIYTLKLLIFLINIFIILNINTLYSSDINTYYI